jgi:polyisoprenoid-binding protein YceI
VNPRQGEILLKEIVIVASKGAVMNAKAVVDMNLLIVEGMPEEEEAMDLTGHLKSSDFFDIALYPTATFVLTWFKSGRGDNKSSVSGSLTLLGVTNSISFDADVQVSDTEVSIHSEDFSIDRSDWGLTYNAEGTAGVPFDYLISDEIEFKLDITVEKQ